MWQQLPYLLISLLFLLSLTLVQSNKILLLLTCAYLITLFIKTQNYRLSLVLVFISLLPFIIGRNIVDVTLIDPREIYGFSIFPVKYFWPIYLSDLLLVLIYQNYFSHKLFNSKQRKKDKLQLTELISFILAGSWLLSVWWGQTRQEFSQLTFLTSLTLVKYCLILNIPRLIDYRQTKQRQTIYQIIAAASLFQAILIILQQLKGGQLGLFIENTLPGFQLATYSAESGNLLRAGGSFNEPNIAASWLLINFIVLTPNYFPNKNRPALTRTIYLIIGLVNLLAIIFTGSRSLYAFAIIYLIVIGLKHWSQIKQAWHKLHKPRYLYYLAILLFLIITPYLATRLTSIKNVFSHHGSLSYRRDLHRHILSMSKQPWGYGLDLSTYYLAKNFKTVDSLNTIFDQAPAHNMLIQLWAETGAISTIIFVFFLYSIFRQAFTKKNNYWAIATFFYLLAAQFHPVFTNHYELTSFFFLYLGLGWYAEKKSATCNQI